MPNLYARQVALTDVKGRIDYISNPLRQENLLATYDTAADLLDGQFWDILAKESQDAFELYGQKTRTVISKKTGELEEKELSCVEAREIHFQLGNEVLDRLSPDEVLKTAIDSASAALGRPVAGALHYNKGMKSLHIHMVYPEREFLQEPAIKVAERNLFFDAQGKRRYKKSEILDENKQLLPGCRIVKKGEIYENRHFGPVDQKFSRKGWLKEFKSEWLLPLRNGELRGNVEITEYDPSTGMLPQMHVGKDKPPAIAEQIREYNRLVNEYNQYLQDGIIEKQTAMDIQQFVMEDWDKNHQLEFQVNAIRKFLEEELQEKKPKKKGLGSVIRRASNRTGRDWRQYSDIRDKTWKTFVQGQRSEFKAINEWREARRQLDFQNSYAVLDPDGNEIGRRLHSRPVLQKNGYFEERDKIKDELRQHTAQLNTMRKYQEVAKGRQKIVRALLLAGAEQDVIDAAMKNYQEAMVQLQNYTNDPAGDFENRRLKVAQWSLAQAQARADAYIRKLEQEKLQEESQLEIQAEQEYQEFQKTGTVAVGGAGGDSKSRATPVLQNETER